MKNYIVCCIIMLLATATAEAQDSYNDRVKKYVDQYYPFAIAEQKTCGIPASITLGQGILETEAGTSELMTEANNHFGIKCKNGWTGETFTHTDDAPDECFKKYKCAEDSYKDHSLHLKRNPRYASLFALSQTDYASWAIGLKKCGYATNPQYAQRLIKIIEDFKLQDYTYSAMDSSLMVNYPTIPEVTKAAATIKPGSDIPVAAVTPPPVVQTAVVPPIKENIVKKEVVDTIQDEIAQPDVSPLKKIADSAKRKVMHRQTIMPQANTDTIRKKPVVAVTGIDGKYENGKTVTINGMKAFYALKGEILLKYAVKNNIRYPHLLEMNDLPDGPLPFNMYVYLQKKPAYGIHTKHTVREGETLLMISQEECIQLKKLMAFNYFNPNDEPATGAILELQEMAARKPDIKFNSLAAHSKNSIVTGNGNVTQGDDYIVLKKAEEDTTMEETDTTVATNDVSLGKQDTGKDDDLVSLKAELDKVVYADDSKLPQAKTTTPSVAKKPVVAAKPVEKKGTKTYKVKRGETALGIAHRNKITVRQLLKWNHIDDDDDIRVGQILRVK